MAEVLGLEPHLVVISWRSSSSFCKLLSAGAMGSTASSYFIILLPFLIYVGIFLAIILNSFFYLNIGFKFFFLNDREVLNGNRREWCAKGTGQMSHFVLCPLYSRVQKAQYQNTYLYYILLHIWSLSLLSTTTANANNNNNVNNNSRCCGC